jgi:hypothetical protein
MSQRRAASLKIPARSKPTNWLTDSLAIRVGNIAKEATGRKCLLFQINKDKSADAPKGFRELVWIQVLE